MKFLIIFAVFLFNSCSSQLMQGNAAASKDAIQFEDRYHYRYTLTTKPFLVIDDQEKMDGIFKIIHSKTEGNRLSPIPTVSTDATYLIFKPVLKTSNDVEIKALRTQNNVLYIDVKPAFDPDVAKNNRVSPNILIKILRKIKISSIKINYL